MANKINYQIELEKTLKNIHKESTPPTLLLHSCCAPCSTYVIEYLSEIFKITIFYYNPNIDELDEYQLRADEQRKLIKEMDTKYKVEFIEGNYDVSLFRKHTKGLEYEEEGGERCHICYAMRLQETYEQAKLGKFDYFTTTLTISPLKDSQKLNEIGLKIEKPDGPLYLPSDFKKKNGYKRSIELSEKHDLYRQNYCGCSFSKL